MSNRWKMSNPKISALVMVVVLCGIVGFSRKTVTAATPQAPILANPKAAISQATGPISIPDTTLAINSPTPMSQRVVHYEIEAKYDAAKHSVDATEVLTYHNLTGQALDHFPFHLYQNAFQPKATFVRDAKLMGTRDTGVRQVGRQVLRVRRHQKH